MKKRIAALALVCCLMLTGCSLDFSGLFRGIAQMALQGSVQPENGAVRFSDMVYTRPDISAGKQALQVLQTAAEKGSLPEILEAYEAFMGFCNDYDTQQLLAQIHYDEDLTSTVWQTESEACNAMSAAVSSMVEDAYRALAASPARKELESEDYFGAGALDGYEGEKVLNDAVLALLDRETELQNRYYTLSGDGTALEKAQLLADLVAVRRELAAAYGYESYSAFAYDAYYYRDYSPEEAKALLEGVRQKLSPIYQRVENAQFSVRYFPERKTLEYLETTAEKMGGSILEAYRLLREAELYDLDYSPNKYGASYEVYLPGYGEPFIFMNPELTERDCLTLAHEFGHFCGDYLTDGQIASIDVQEVFSQAMEFLSLPENAQRMTRGKLADSLATYVEQACYASFEMALYQEENLTAQGVLDLFAREVQAYGIAYPGFSPEDVTEITHFYTNPMYVISYVVSNDGAMQIYEKELEEPGRGLELFLQGAQAQEDYPLVFFADIGLESPFSDSRLNTAAAFFASVFPE